MTNKSKPAGKSNTAGKGNTSGKSNTAGKGNASGKSYAAGKGNASGKNKTTSVKAKAVASQKGGFSRFAEWAGERLWAITVALFALSFVIRLLLSFWSGPMVQIVYPDETRFFDIARSLAENGAILVRGIPTTFQKILYPLFITPAFLLADDQIVQMNIIRIINCALVSSTVFPVAMLAKKLTSNRTVALISLLFTISLPDMAYSATFMSESLYMPLCIWLFYIACCAVTERKLIKRLVYFVILGLLSYLVYFTKEIGAAFVIAAALLLIVDTIRGWQRQNQPGTETGRGTETATLKQHRFDTRLLARNALSAAALSAAFFGTFLALKLTAFQGMGNTYAIEENDHITLAALSSPTVLLYLVYSAATLFIAAILSFYAAPAFLAVHGYGAMNEENKKAFLFSAFSFIVMIGAIAYTLSIREDLGEPVPRLHMRFVAPLVIPLMIQCLDYLFSETGTKPGRLFSKAFPAAAVVFCAAAIVLVPSGSATGYLMDHYTLKSTFPVESFIIQAGQVTINVLFIFFKLFLIALAIIGVYLVAKKKKFKPVIVMLLCSVLLINAFDNFMSYTSTRRMKTADFSMAEFYGPSASHLELAFSREGKEFSYRIVDSLISTNKRLRSLDGTVIVFMSPDYAPYTDTYLDLRAFPVQPGALYNLALDNGGRVNIARQPIWEGNRYNSNYLDLDTWKRGLFTADYIITLNTPEEPHPFLNVIIVYENWPFVILRNLDPEVIYIEL